MKNAELNTFKDGDKTITQRPEFGCFDAKGNFIGVPEEGKEILLGNDSANEEKPAENAS